MLVLRMRIQTQPDRTDEVAAIMNLLPDALAAPPEATVYHVSSEEAAI